MSTYDFSLICNGIGVLGFMLYMTSYTLVTFQRIDSRGLLFFCLNTGAATFVLISLTQNFNLASMMIQIVWICLGIIAIVKRVSRPTAMA
jgi:predicted membrane protein